jgi:hypothetical protein
LALVRLYFCDESGDPGASLESGASAIFVICVIGYRHAADALRFQHAESALRARLNWRGEFRWSRMGRLSRRTYFESLAGVLPLHHAVVWDKRSCRPASTTGFGIQVDMMRQAVVRLCAFDDSGRMIIDGVRHRDRASSIRSALGLSHVRFETSHSNPHLQLADMLAGFHAWDHKGRVDDLMPSFQALRACRSDWR